MLTHRQRQLFEFVAGQVTATGVAPTRREMADHLGLVSASGANRMLDALEERGFIKRMPHRALAIAIEPGRRAKVFIFNSLTKKLEPLQ